MKDDERRIADLFRKAGWTVLPQANGPDFIVRKGRSAYVVEVKRSSEARADRLVPQLSQGILQARRYAQGVPDAAPLVVVVASRVPTRVVEQVKTFASDYAPDVAIGIVDSRGLRDFSEEDLTDLNASPSMGTVRFRAVEARPADLFSDLNQWLLKLMLAPHLNQPDLLNAPLRHYKNASELARAADVSVMTAFRFLRQLRVDGYLHEDHEALRIVRLDELLERWRTVAFRPTAGIPARWVLPGDRRKRIAQALKPLDDDACLGLFAAADALHVGIVRGAATHVYVRTLTAAISRMRLLTASELAGADVIVKVPSAPESVFRAAVTVDGIRTSDVLQVWLDVQNEPTRGKEQAQALQRRIIEPMLKRAKHGQRR
jgi:hypothetical protein